MSSASGSTSEPADIAALIPGLRLHARYRIGPRLRQVLSSNSLVGDALLDYVRHQAKLSRLSRRRLLAWLHTAMEFRILRALRKLTPRDGATILPIGSGSRIDLADPTTNHEYKVARKELAEYVVQQILHLEEREQILLLGHLRDGLSHAELGAILNLSADTAQVAYCRALKKLKERMESLQ